MSIVDAYHENAPATTYGWKQGAWNVTGLAPGDFNGDGNLDVAWGATAATPGCTVAVATGQTCTGVGGTSVTPVNDGELRIFWGNGDGTFRVDSPYYVATALHSAGTLVADLGTDTSSLTVGDVDGDDDADIVAGTIDGTNAAVKLLKNNGDGTFAPPVTLISVTAGANVGSPIYYPPTSTQMNSSPWGLALADVDVDGDLDLWVGDRALYVYSYRNDGSGAFTLQPGNVIATRPNAYLAHETYRDSVGYTPSLASADVNGDGRPDVVFGMDSGAQTPTSTGCTSGGVAVVCPNDGRVLLDVSSGSGYSAFGFLADLGTAARGVSLVDVNGDGAKDIVAVSTKGRSRSCAS